MDVDRFFTSGDWYHLYNTDKGISMRSSLSFYVEKKVNKKKGSETLTRFDRCKFVFLFDHQEVNFSRELIHVTQFSNILFLWIKMGV
jgi:hypothetical protein